MGMSPNKLDTSLYKLSVMQAFDQMEYRCITSKPPSFLSNLTGEMRMIAFWENGPITAMDLKQDRIRIDHVDIALILPLTDLEADTMLN